MRCENHRNNARLSYLAQLSTSTCIQSSTLRLSSRQLQLKKRRLRRHARWNGLMEPQELKFNLFPHINISFDQFYFYYICSCRSGEAAKKNQVRPNSPISKKVLVPWTDASVSWRLRNSNGPTWPSFVALTESRDSIWCYNGPSVA